MNVLDLFNTVYERALNEGAVDDLEARYIHGLNTKMLDLMSRTKESRYRNNPKALAGLRREYEKIKDERDSYYKVREAGIPGSVPTEKIPGKEDLLKGRGRSYYESQKKNSEAVDEGQVSDKVDHRGDVDTKANIEVLDVDLDNDTFKITYNGKPYQVKTQLFSQEDLGRWQISDYDVDIINRKGKNIIDLIDWDNDRQVTMVNTIIAYLDTQQASDIQLMAWRQVGIENSTAEELYQEIQDFYKNDQQKIDKATAWLAQNMEDVEQRQVFADFVKNPVSRPARTKYIPKEYLMYVAFSYSREGNTELTPGMNLKPIQLDDPDDEEEYHRKVDELIKKVQFKFDAFENKIVELADSYGLGSDPDLGSGFGQREIVWDHKTKTTSSSESNLNRQQILAQSILKFQADVKKYVESFNNTLIKIGLPGIGEHSTWAGVLGDQLTDQQVRYFDTPEGFANLAAGKVDIAKMLDDNVEKLGLKETGNPPLGEKKLGQLRPTLGTGRDIGKSVKKFRAQRGLDEYISMGSDKNYIEAEPYKNYRIYVRKKPFGTPGMYTAHTEIDRKEFKEPGASQEEAVQAIRDRIDSLLNAQRKVTGSSTIDFNVKFATDLLADPRQTFYAKLEKINGEPKLVIASADIASDPELLAAGDFKRSALRNQPDEQGRATPLPGIPLTAKGLRSGDWIANGRYTVGNETQDRDGNRVFDLTYHSTAHTKSDKLRLNRPAFTLGTTREVDEEKSTGPLDQKLQRLKVQARRQFPRAHTDDEALVLKLLDKETQDDRLNRQTDARQDAELRKNFALDRDQEDEIEDLQTQVGVKEHGGGIGPKQRWQDLMPEQYNDDDYADEEETDLRSGDYVRDTMDGESGEIFRMQGDPYERRVRILDRDGKGWYIEPSRLTRVGPSDPDIQRYFGKKRVRDMDEAVDEKGALKSAQAAAKFIIRNLDDRGALKDYSMHFWSPEKFYQGATMAMRGAGYDEIVKQITQDRPAQFESGVTETVTNVQAGMARIYHRLAPKIERYKDSFLAGQLYDELENYAELHGAETEFKRMMNGARNRAHMEYDTNPGGFQNWFWFLPFEDKNVAEGWSDAMLSRRTGQPRTPYSVYIKGKKWKDFADDDHARAVMNKLKTKFKTDGRDPETITIAPTDMSEGIKKGAAATALAVCMAAGGTLSGCATNPSVGGAIGTVRDVGTAAKTASAMTRAGVQGELSQELRNFIRAQGGDPGGQNLSLLYKLQNRLQGKKDSQSINEVKDTEAVEQAILKRIMVGHKDMLMKYGPEKIMTAASNVAYDVGDIGEMGSSDISGWVKQVQYILGARP